MERPVNDIINRERLSSAFTLSDMEIFIFPELFYPLVLANIMSPELWKWRDDPWFREIGDRNFISRMNRIKQYIIDNYIFNLDLETWGMTTKEKEIARFSEFFDTSFLASSNALFGYEGDKYYFDLDIRKHFGLDRYNTNVIPYWKTETLEAMNAFRYKDGFSTGAGECVSLSALYAAAVFVVGRIPLEKIFMIATPLHSQNFINEQDGVLTNNRRIVTRNMWYNGTSLSDKARRALEKERVTIVSHISGYIHSVYNKATINREAYHEFSKSLTSFLNISLTPDIFLNFLRANASYRKCFQFRVGNAGRERYIPVEKIFEYEHSSRFNLTTETRKRLLGEIDGDEFSLSPFTGRYLLNDLEEKMHGRDLSGTGSLSELLRDTGYDISHLRDHNLVNDLYAFISTTPELPGVDTEFIESISPAIDIGMERQEIIEQIKSSSKVSEMSMLALYVYRMMDLIDWEPFIKASIERNNVSYDSLSGLDCDLLHSRIDQLPNISVYDTIRVALPDEVWNFGRGDGVEKAMLMASVINNDHPGSEIVIDISGESVKLDYSGKSYSFISSKNLYRHIEISANGYYCS